jgi:CubicO group peptidase (beta-lactamase class C family)
MVDISGLRGAVLLQRGNEDLVASAAGATGSGGGCSLGTRFQVSSMSKQFTAAAVLLLADRGVLSVDDPVSRWLDGCPAAWKPITVHHLLSIPAGWPTGAGCPGWI